VAEEKQQPEDRQQPEHRTITFGEASALVVVLGAGVYVLGLLALWAPLAHTYTGNYVTAWYAVSLLPRTAIIGQGLLLIGAPLLITLGFFVMDLVLVAVVQSVSRREEMGLGRASLTAVGIAGGLLGGLALIGKIANPIRLDKNPSYLDWLLPFLPVLAIGAYTISYSFLWSKVSTLGRGMVVVGLASVLVTAFTLALTRETPALPAVQITANTSVEGELLTHVDGFWHVFDEQGTLVAIPDDDVSEVRINEGQ